MIMMRRIMRRMMGVMRRMKMRMIRRTPLRMMMRRIPLMMEKWTAQKQCHGNSDHSLVPCTYTLYNLTLIWQDDHNVEIYDQDFSQTNDDNDDENAECQICDWHIFHEDLKPMCTKPEYVKSERLQHLRRPNFLFSASATFIINLDMIWYISCNT